MPEDEYMLKSFADQGLDAKSRARNTVDRKLCKLSIFTSVFAPATPQLTAPGPGPNLEQKQLQGTSVY